MPTALPYNVKWLRIILATCCTCNPTHVHLINSARYPSQTTLLSASDFYIQTLNPSAYFKTYISKKLKTLSLKHIKSFFNKKVPRIDYSLSTIYPEGFSILLYQLHVQALPCFFAPKAFGGIEAKDGGFFVDAIHKAGVVEFFDVAIFEVGVENPGFVAEVAFFDEAGEFVDGEFSAGFGAEVVKDEEVAVAQEVEDANGVFAVLAALKFADADEVEEVVGAAIDDA